MKIIVGLGNIGSKYENTRHNAGFLALDELATQFEDIEWAESGKFDSIIAKVEINGEDVLLVKPTTLMNLSGRAVAKILNFYKLTPADLIVIYDDIDLDLGTIRFREKGSAGTHNGMKSIISSIGSEEFKRIRIGIESRSDKALANQPLNSFVLSNFTEKEREILEESLKEAVKKAISLTSS